MDKEDGMRVRRVKGEKGSRRMNEKMNEDRKAS